jgi:beta-glucuronidase
MNWLTIVLAAVCLNGPWQFKFEEDKPLEAAGGAAFVADDVMSVPGCWDVLPRYYLKHGTGLYRRAFTLDAPMKDAVLVVEGMGLRASFAVDGVEKGGVQSYPYARLEIPVGPLAAGAHEIFAAVDNIQEWPRVKLARPYYDFYFYGGFYHGVKLVEKAPKVFVRTRDYATGTVEVQVEGAVPAGAKLAIDGRPVAAEWKDGRAVVKVPGFKLWSPDEPNLHALAVTLPGDAAQPDAVTFGIRQVEAKAGKIFLNGRPLFLKGFNRHESSMLEGSATGDATMLRDIQNLKAVGGNFLRGAHYQQSERFLDLCDRAGVLVWEESLGWGNGHGYTSRHDKLSEPDDAEFCDMQERQTREMVRASFNHPSVIIYGFLNECASDKPVVKALVDRLAATIRKEDSGRLVTFACNMIDKDISCESVDLVSINAYPGTIPMTPGRPEELKRQVEKRFDSAIERFLKLYPEKPLIVSESGCGAVPGARDPLNASPSTEDFQDEYLRDILMCLWANPHCSGYAIWQMNDGRTRERFWQKACSVMFGGSVAGCFDEMRRPKKSVATVKSFFEKK